MTIIEKLQLINDVKFSFGKQHLALQEFSRKAVSCSMFDPGLGLGISPQLSGENQLRGVFIQIIKLKGFFTFNINGVNLERARSGFTDYEEAESNNMITEWELWMIINNTDYLKRTIFHNQVIEIQKIKNGIQFLWI